MSESGWPFLQLNRQCAPHDVSHVLAYLGEKMWIEADPDVMKVITVRQVMKKALRNILIMATSVCAAVVVSAGDFQSFITTINTNWVSCNHSGIIQAVDARLYVKTNDLPALVAKADYYTTITLNMSIVSNLVPKIEQLRTNLTWTSDEGAGAILDEMIDSMKSKNKCEQTGYVYGFSSNQLMQLHLEFPTNHPGAIFFTRFAIIQYGTSE